MPPNCCRCEHYYVTWDKDYPHGCRAMAFKSRVFPYRMVRESTPHAECLSFKMKPQTRRGSASARLRRPPGKGSNVAQDP